MPSITCQDFIKTLAKACQNTGWQAHAYCLVRDHYHLVPETPNASLVAGMASPQSSYTIRFNHRTTGSPSTPSLAGLRHRPASTNLG